VSARTTGKLQAAAAATNTPAATGQTATIYDLIESNKAQIGRALPNHLSADRFTKLLWNECRKTPQLMQCTPASLMGAAMYAAQLGLEPGPLQLIYLTPRRVKGVWQVVPIIGYKGYLSLARRSGDLASIDAEAIYANDEFRWVLGLHRDVHHKAPEPFGSDRGEIIGFYAIAHLKSGETPFEVLTRAQVEARRDRGSAKDTGPWATDFVQMGRKTAIRALVPFLPLSAEAQVAAATDEHVRTPGPDLFAAPDDEPALEVVDVDPGDPPEPEPSRPGDDPAQPPPLPEPEPQP
jgi:recombination protein RecT